MKNSLLILPTLVVVGLAFANTPVVFATAAASNSNTFGLFRWAKQHGAIIDDGIEIRQTKYGGRGLFATRHISANTELIRIPYDLQLGVKQLAEGTDTELQTMSRNLPWQYIMQSELFFVPFTVAVCAERRKGKASKFEPFLRELFPLGTHSLNINTIQRTTVSGEAANEDEDRNNDNDLTELKAWAPTVAQKVLDRRNGIKTIYQQTAPPSLTFEEFSWAAINVCSRSLVRKRKPELPVRQMELIGEFSASDRTRLLPVIDLVNHGSLHHANVKVGHLSSRQHTQPETAATSDDTPSPASSSSSSDGGDDDANDFSTSLKSTRDIQAGEELLFDYGGGNGEAISNERLLLDYGFVLSDHTKWATVSLDEFVPALMALDDDARRENMRVVPKEDTEDIDALARFLINQASKVQSSGGSPLVFDSLGKPSVLTLAIVLAMTCGGQEDVTRVLKPLRSNPKDGSLLPAQIVEGCTKSQIRIARDALRSTASLALAQRIPALSGGDEEACQEAAVDQEESFAQVARKYAIFCRSILEKATTDVSLSE